MAEVRKVGVVGLGAMGAGIAQLCIEAGVDTLSREVTSELGEKARDEFANTDITPLVVSCVASFVSALLATKFLLRYVSKHSFGMFAWYRIVFGAVILVTAFTGLVDW